MTKKRLSHKEVIEQTFRNVKQDEMSIERKRLNRDDSLSPSSKLSYMNDMEHCKVDDGDDVLLCFAPFASRNAFLPLLAHYWHKQSRLWHWTMMEIMKTCSGYQLQ